MENADFGYYVQLPLEIIQHPRLSMTARIVWAYLNWRQGNNVFCWPKGDTIAQDLGCCRNTIITALNQLRQEGEIEVVRRAHGGKNQSNAYCLARKKCARDTTSGEPGAHTLGMAGAQKVRANGQSGAQKLRNKTNQGLINQQNYHQKPGGSGLCVEDFEENLLTPELEDQVSRHIEALTEPNPNLAKCKTTRSQLRKLVELWDEHTITQIISKHAMQANSVGMFKYYLKNVPTKAEVAAEFERRGKERQEQDERDRVEREALEEQRKKQAEADRLASEQEDKARQGRLVKQKKQDRVAKVKRDKEQTKKKAAQEVKQRKYRASSIESYRAAVTSGNASEVRFLEAHFQHDKNITPDEQAEIQAIRQGA